MPLLKGDDLERIDLPAEGEWVEVKRRPSRGDLVRVQQMVAAGAHLGADKSGGFQVSDLSAPSVVEAAEFATLDVAIKRWSFPEAVTPDGIRELDEASVDCIKASLNKMTGWSPRTEDERTNLSGNGATPPSEKAPHPATSNG